MRVCLLLSPYRHRGMSSQPSVLIPLHSWKFNCRGIWRGRKPGHRRTGQRGGLPKHFSYVSDGFLFLRIWSARLTVSATALIVAGTQNCRFVLKLIEYLSIVISLTLMRNGCSSSLTCSRLRCCIREPRYMRVTHEGSWY